MHNISKVFLLKYYLSHRGVYVWVTSRSVWRCSCRRFCLCLAAEVMLEKLNGWYFLPSNLRLRACMFPAFTLSMLSWVKFCSSKKNCAVENFLWYSAICFSRCWGPRGLAFMMCPSCRSSGAARVVRPEQHDEVSDPTPATDTLLKTRYYALITTNRLHTLTFHISQAKELPACFVALCQWVD